MHEFEEKDYNEKLNIGIWKKIFLLIGKNKYFYYSLIAVGILAGFDAAFPLFNRYAIDNFAKAGTLDGLGQFGIMYGIFLALFALNVYVFIRFAGIVEVETAYQLRKKAYKRLQELSFSYYDKTPMGWIMARMTSDANRLANILSWGMIDITWGFLMMFAILIIMFIINWQLALVVIVVLPPLAYISIYFRKKILKAYREVRKINSTITAGFNEGIMGAKTTKTLVLEQHNLEEFGVKTFDMRKYSVRAAILSGMFFPIVLVIGYVGTALAIYYGGLQVNEMVITVGTLFLFLTYSMQFFDPVMQIARIFAEFQQAQASAERILSLIETDPEISDTLDVTEKYGDLFNKKTENWEDIAGDIEFKNVSFKYKDGQNVLDDFNLKIKAGTSVALVGETGAGKSTIVNLICRFYEPTKGQILIDNIDYKERSIGWLHSNLGYVLQSPHLFSGTVKENIRYGNLEATDEQVIEAAKVVNAHEFIMRNENEYNLEVGEGGNKLSVGEKQLVSFARAIIADPKILILDEATSSIDTETEKLIQDAIDKLLKGRTSFIVAHRLSTIRNSDLILVLKDGKVIEQGTHEELLKLKGYYYNLYLNQFAEDQIKSVKK